jgi:Zn finger protein HypA/HybF involved in hydrogenase expression
LRICLSCGTIAPTSNTDCGRCGVRFEDNTRDLTPEEVSFMPARIKGHFECRSCGKEVPLNYLALDTVPCASCGIDQAVSWDLWEDVLAHAHNTADLTGNAKPHLGDELFWRAFRDEEGEDITAMFRGIGLRKSTLTKGNDYFGGVQYALDVSPGHPLCERCREPLELEASEEAVRASCPACKSSREYSRWIALDKYKGLIAAMAEEHRSDTPAVKTEAGAGAVAITCPNCGGALDVSSAGSFVTCGFCNTACHVPHKLVQKVTGKPVPEAAWWLLFEGPSPLRRQIDRRIEILRHKQDMAKKRRLMEAEQEAEEALQARRFNRNLLLWVLGIFAALLIVAYFFKG